MIGENKMKSYAVSGVIEKVSGCDMKWMKGDGGVKRSPLVRKTPLKRTGFSKANRSAIHPKPRPALRPVSPKREREQRIYAKLRKEFLANNPICQVRYCCYGDPASDCHHAAGRIGSLYLDMEYFVAACRKCHNHIHAFPGWARFHGWLRKKSEKSSCALE